MYTLIIRCRNIVGYLYIYIWRRYIKEGYTYSWIFIYGGDILRRDTHIVGYLYIYRRYIKEGYTYSWIFIYGGDILRKDTHKVGWDT